MTTRPRLQTGGLPVLSEDASSATTSPARGKEMRTNLLQKLRPPPLVHAWDFWHEKAPVSSPRARSATTRFSTSPPSSVPSIYHTSRAKSPPSQDATQFTAELTILQSIADVRAFWSVFNNFDFTTLPLRSSCHLFHKSIKPLWEDPRNVRGGSWTFRITNDNKPQPSSASIPSAPVDDPRSSAIHFFQEVCLLAIGEQLQAVVTDPERKVFKDDICGVSFSPRFGSCLIQVWNRDGDHEEGVAKILQTVVDSLPDDLKPKEGSYYYKRHCDHAGFNQDLTAGAKTEAATGKHYVGNMDAAAANGEAFDSLKTSTSMPNHSFNVNEELKATKERRASVVETVEQMEKEVQKVRDILEDVMINNEAMSQKLVMAAGREAAPAEGEISSKS